MITTALASYRTARYSYSDTLGYRTARYPLATAAPQRSLAPKATSSQSYRYPMALYWLASHRCHRVDLDAPSLFMLLGAARRFHRLQLLTFHLPLVARPV